MRNWIAISFALLCLLPAAGFAQWKEQFATHVPNAQLVGEGKLTYMLWDVYTAHLYAPGGNWNMEEPFALTLHYLRHLNGKAIAERSVEEIRKQGFRDEVKLAAWYREMESIFPDVNKGDEITGIYLPGKKTVFYLNGEKIGHVMDAEFGTHFFNIWLDAKTSEPELRQMLVGSRGN